MHCILTLFLKASVSQLTLEQARDFAEAILWCVCTEVMVRTSEDLAHFIKDFDDDLLIAKVVLDGKIMATVLSIEMVSTLWDYHQFYPYLIEEGKLLLFCTKEIPFFRRDNPDGMISTINFSCEEQLIKAFDLCSI